MTKITPQQYYAALGLFVLGQQASNKAQEYDNELHKLLGLEESGTHISDELHCDGNLDTALKKMKITVSDDTEQ